MVQDIKLKFPEYILFTLSFYFNNLRAFRVLRG